MAEISIFDIFKVGVGPSSSHTVGPMKAAREYALALAELPQAVARVELRLYGSLAFTGRGHGTDAAVLLGLGGAHPASVDPDTMEPTLRAIYERRKLTLAGGGEIDFDPDTQLVFDYEEELPRHTNGMRFAAFDANDRLLLTEDWYSLGGGFVVRGDEEETTAQQGEPPYPFSDARTLLELAHDNGLTIDELVYRNERHWRTAEDIRARIDELWAAMRACVQRGLTTEGVLPGKMTVLRRAPKIHKALKEQIKRRGSIDTMDWVNAYAIAVNEENAAGGRVVTSPTNGAAGILPAVMHYYSELVPDADQAGIDRLLLTAGAIGILYKSKASISGAEMGCQGEVGVACSMAAGGLVSALGGSNAQIENAAEIGMEHNLGLTCDPVGGLVQIPCIERNAMGAVKAINAASLALHGDGTHKVSLDQVISTMRQTGIDMSTIYKETSRGGLAVNVPEC